MAVPRLSVPVTPGLSWVLPVPEHWLGAARRASSASLRDLEAAVAPPDCPTCARFVAHALKALSATLDDALDDDPPAAPTD